MKEERTDSLRIALLHLAPVSGEIYNNRSLIEKAVSLAAANGASWIITPEVCTCGYSFSRMIGTDWILPQPDERLRSFCRLVEKLNVTLFFAQPERDARTGRLHNSLFVIGPGGKILGRHRKIMTLKIGSEAWSSPGTDADCIDVPPVGKVGILICADAYPEWIAEDLKKKGARLLVSPAAWGPGPYGPNGEWERCTKDTGLPLIVCNRTGPDKTLDFSDSRSVVASAGKRLLSLSSKRSAIFLIEWDQLKQVAALLFYSPIYL
jgi:N-carbamoylputrescine amidase